jgi:hypothetical protein
MKRYILAAGALLLGTSAYALAVDDDKQAAVEPAKLAEQAAYPGWDKPLAEPKLSDASFAAWDNPEAKLENAALLAATDPAVRSKLALAAADAVNKDQAGLGGPFEEADAATAADLIPRPAAQNYPPCDPGPGDDNCIQLYEPGVRAQLAGWNRPTGGLLDHSATTAMGGPYEPVDQAALDKPANEAEAQLASVYKPAPSADGAMGGPYEPVDEAADKPATVAEADLASVYKPANADELAHHSAGEAMGGPVEAQSGYPPCDPGPGDDRCIQLYEPGVTGVGN